MFFLAQKIAKFFSSFVNWGFLCLCNADAASEETKTL